MSDEQDSIKEIDQILDRAEKALQTCAASDEERQHLSSILEVHKASLIKCRDALEFCSKGYKDMLKVHLETSFRELDNLIAQMQSYEDKVVDSSS